MAGRLGIEVFYVYQCFAERGVIRADFDVLRQGLIGLFRRNSKFFFTHRIRPNYAYAPASGCPSFGGSDGLTINVVHLPPHQINQLRAANQAPEREKHKGDYAPENDSRENAAFQHICYQGEDDPG